jgi:hypothetical protein
MSSFPRPAPPYGSEHAETFGCGSETFAVCQSSYISLVNLRLYRSDLLLFTLCLFPVQALASYSTLKNFQLVKRCLYLVGSLPPCLPSFLSMLRLSPYLIQTYDRLFMLVAALPSESGRLPGENSLESSIMQDPLADLSTLASLLNQPLCSRSRAHAEPRKSCAHPHFPLAAGPE